MNRFEGVSMLKLAAVVMLVLLFASADERRAFCRGIDVWLGAKITVILFTMPPPVTSKIIGVLFTCLQIFVKFAVIADVLLVIRGLKSNPNVGFFAGNKICYSNLEPAATASTCDDIQIIEIVGKAEHSHRQRDRQTEMLQKSQAIEPLNRARHSHEQPE